MSLSGVTDFEKWSRFKSGDATAFSMIFNEYSSILYFYGLKFTRDNILVEDSIQDLFTDLLKNCRNLGDTDNIQFYLLKSFKRRLFKNIKKEKRSFNLQNADDCNFNITYSIEHQLINEDISKEKTELLIRALKSLTPRQKEAIYLKFTRELDYKEVSGVMEISVEGCRNLIAKAIKTLKESVSERNGIIFFLMHSG